MSTSSKNDMILSGHVNSANRHENKELKIIVSDAKQDKNADIYGYKRFPSKKNSDFLQKKCFKNKIMQKAYRNKKLSKKQKKENLKNTKIRCNIGKVFGILKEYYGLRKTKYLGIIKTNYLFLMSAICFNLKKTYKFFF